MYVPKEVGKLELREVDVVGSPLAYSNATNAPATLTRRRLFLKEQLSSKEFLIDSGSDVTIIAASKSSYPLVTTQLRAANGTEIPVYDCREITFDFGMNRRFRWKTFFE